MSQQRPAPQTPYYSANPAFASTPDGQPLATWWSRVWASLIDGVITTAVLLVLGAGLWGEIFSAYGDFVREATDAAAAGRPAPSQQQLMSDLQGPLLTVALIGFAVVVVYHATFLRWRQATPGKLLLGLRVRDRDRPGTLGWGAIAARIGVQFWSSLVTTVPVVGTLASLFPLLDSLWPLGNRDRQALHDKAAGTVVVRVR